MSQLITSNHDSKSIPQNIKIIPGKKYKFIVNSAEEAVTQIRDMLGVNAKVLSVKQLKGKGLLGFLSSSRLEIIAQLPEEDKIIDQNLLNIKSAENDEKENLINDSSSKVNINFKLKDSKDEPEKSLPDIVLPVQFKGKLDSLNIKEFLIKLGFTLDFITHLENSDEWERFQHLSISAFLIELVQWIRRVYSIVKVRPLTQRIAFIGAPASGKTTALCKHITHQVFMKNQLVDVLKLDTEIPNSDDALRVFCDVIGVQLFRDFKDIPNSHQSNIPLYVDLPGLSMRDKKEINSIGKSLDELNINTRILVINGAYDIDIIKEQIILGSQLSATHCVLTHLDEIKNYSKFWSILFTDYLTPLFISNGASVTGDYDENVLEFLLKNSFPRKLFA